MFRDSFFFFFWILIVPFDGLTSRDLFCAKSRFAIDGEFGVGKGLEVDFMEREKIEQYLYYERI